MPVYRTPDGRIVEETTLVRPRSKAAKRPDADTAPNRDAMRRRGETVEAGASDAGTGLDAPTVVYRPGTTPPMPPTPARQSGDEPTKLAGAVPTMPGATERAGSGASDARAGLDAPTVVYRPGTTLPTPARRSGDEATRLAGAVPTMLTATDPGPALMAAATDPGPVAGWLVVVEGPGSGRDLRVGVGRNDLGRSSENRISLPFGDARISRRCHLWINYDPRHRVFSVVPGTGANLAYLDDTAIEERMLLTGGATIAVGDTRLRFVAFCDHDFSWPEE